MEHNFLYGEKKNDNVLPGLTHCKICNKKLKFEGERLIGLCEKHLLDLARKIEHFDLYQSKITTKMPNSNRD